MKGNKYILNNPHLKENPFQVPEDYFESNFIKINSKINSDTEPFNVPEDYFESNKIKLIEKIYSKKNTSSFGVPENYFEHNQEKLVRSLGSKTALPITKKRIIRFIQYSSAVAAAVAVVWGIQVFFQSENTNTPFDSNCKTIACLTKKDILSKEVQLDDEIVEESVSDEMIEQHFSTPDKTPANTNDSNDYNQLNETF